MKTTITFLLSVVLLTIVGCASISYLPTDESKTYAPTSSLKIYWEKPQEPYTIIGKVSAESGDYTQETLFKKLKEKAKAVGAHAIIMNDPSQESSIVGTPAYNGGTMILPVTINRLDAIAIRFEK
jgi:hypothetical protein